jgi:cytochrome c oxidase subunit 1
MLYSLGFLELFTIGGLTGVFLATLAIDVHMTDTYFVIAHFHYVMVGGTLMGFIGGIHYWFPKMTGRMYSETHALWAFILVLLGFNLTFFPQFIVGSQGMPRRYWSYLPEFTTLNQLSTIGSLMLLAGFSWTAVYLWRGARSGPKAPANPWDGKTLEWQTSSPPPHENFRETPVVTEWPYEYRS